MTDIPCYVKAHFETPEGQIPFVRIEGRDKLTTIFRLDMSLESFGRFGLNQEVLAAFTTPGAR